MVSTWVWDFLASVYSRLMVSASEYVDFIQVLLVVDAILCIILLNVSVPVVGLVSHFYLIPEMVSCSSDTSFASF
jgi:hypothetical protein